jgi:hypothetical protein
VLGIVLGPFVSIPRPEQAKGASNDKA